MKNAKPRGRPCVPNHIKNRSTRIQVKFDVAAKNYLNELLENPCLINTIEIMRNASRIYALLSSKGRGHVRVANTTIELVDSESIIKIGRPRNDDSSQQIAWKQQLIFPTTEINRLRNLKEHHQLFSISEVQRQALRVYALLFRVAEEMESTIMVNVGSKKLEIQLW